MSDLMTTVPPVADTSPASTPSAEPIVVKRGKGARKPNLTDKAPNAEPVNAEPAPADAKPQNAAPEKAPSKADAKPTKAERDAARLAEIRLAWSAQSAPVQAAARDLHKASASTDDLGVISLCAQVHADQTKRAVGILRGAGAMGALTEALRSSLASK